MSKSSRRPRAKFAKKPTMKTNSPDPEFDPVVDKLGKDYLIAVKRSRKERKMDWAGLHALRYQVGYFKAQLGKEVEKVTKAMKTRFR